MRRVIILYLAVVCFISCSDSLERLSLPSEGLPIQISGSISQQNLTRANEQGFVTGDRMGIYVVDRVNGEPGVLGASDNRAQNMIYTFDGDSYTWSSPTTIYWRDQQTAVDIYGYYPAVNFISDPKTYNFEVRKDQSTEAGNGDLSGYEQSDLLWGRAVNVGFTTECIIVNYHHIMAGVRVQLEKGEGISDTEWEKLPKQLSIDNTVRSGTVDLSDGSIAPGTGVSPINMAPQSGNSFRAVVIPQTVSAGKQLLSITIDGLTYGYTRETTMDYQSGKLHNFTMTVNKREPTGDYEISVTDDGITPWINDESSHLFSSMQYVIVNCPQYGTLKQCIADAGLDYKTIKNLKVTGELTAEDFSLLRDEMPELRHLNLRDVKVRHIRYYNGWDDYGNHEHDRFHDDELPSGAFARNDYIRSLVLPSSLKIIGNEAFYGTRGLMYSTLEIPDGVTKVETGAFNYTGDCTTVELILPSTIDSIGMRAFSHCGFKCELTLSDNITYIGGGAFDETPNFYGTFHIPSKLKQLDGVFAGLGSNDSFTGEIEIPQGVDYVSGLSVSLKNWVEITIPPGVKKIGGGWPARISQLNLNDDLESIEGGEVFRWHKLPFQLKLPSALRRVDTYAFDMCGIEGELIIPENCLNIGVGAFSHNGLTKITLPSKLEVINREVFQGSHLLTTVTIPKYVNYIGERAFASCDGLQTVICLNPEPPTIEKNSFDGLYFDKVILEVPEQSVELYRHDDNWKRFLNITPHYELAFNVPEIVCLDKGTTRQGILRAEGDWEVSECPSWVTVSPSSGTYKNELTVTVDATTESREGRIVFRLKDQDYTTYTDVRQVFSADNREDATVILQEAASDGIAIPIFLVGEGYGADDIASGQYLEDMKQQMEHLFSTEPYKSYRNYFTVSTAIACSPEKGLNGLTKFSNNDNQVLQYAKQHGTSVTDGTAILVLCNTEAYGCHTDLWDNGTSFSWLGKNEDIYPYDQRGDVLHYLGGRGFGKLGPEFVNHFTFMKACTCPGCDMTWQYQWAREKGWWQNVSTTPKMTELPWYPFIFHEKYAQLVDVYEGALNHARSTYRSENLSVMGAVHVYYYNAISRYEIVKRIMQAAGKIITLEQFIASDQIELPED